MVQEPVAASGGSSFRAEAGRQASRILVSMAMLESIACRGARAIPGLRLSEENRLLAGLYDICVAAAPVLRTSLLAAGVLAVAAFGAALAGGGLASRAQIAIAAIGTIAAAAWTMGAETGRLVAVGAAAAAMILVSAVAGRASPGLALAPLGALAALVWPLVPDHGDLTALALERSAEVLLLLAAPVAALPFLADSARRGRLLIESAAAAALAAILFLAASDAARHVAGHLLEIDRAGLPYPLTAGMLIAAAGGFVALGRSGIPARPALLGVFLVFIAGRAGGPEHLALRLAASLLIVSAVERFPRRGVAAG